MTEKHGAGTEQHDTVVERQGRADGMSEDNAPNWQRLPIAEVMMRISLSGGEFMYISYVDKWQVLSFITYDIYELIVIRISEELF